MELLNNMLMGCFVNGIDEIGFAELIISAFFRNILFIEKKNELMNFAH